MVQSIRACLITNPKSGKGGIDLAPILPVLAAHGWQADVRQKLKGGHATELAKQAVKDGYDVVVACGGDGTVGEVVDGVVGTEIPVGVLPGGTANLWAHEIGVSMDLHEAALQLVGAQRRRVDVGHVAINGGHGQHFLLMAGLGMDGAVLDRLNKDWKKRIGALAYLPAIGRALPASTPFSANLDLDGISRQEDAVQIVVGNTRRYASVTSVTPEAMADDGKLDVCVLSPGNPISAAQQITTLILRNRPSPVTAVTDRVAHLKVQTTTVIPLQADGGRIKQKNIEPKDDGVTYEFTVRAQALNVLVPRDYSGDLFHGAPSSTSAAPASANAPKADGKAEKDDKKLGKRYRVISTGIDTVTVARERDGKVMTVIIDAETRARDAEGAKQSLTTFLSSLSEGQTIRIKGTKTKGEPVIHARRLRL